MRDAFLCQRTKKRILALWQLHSLLAAFRLSVLKSGTIDLPLNPLLRQYVAQLATQAGLLPTLVKKLFPINVRYGIDVRYVAAFLSDQENFIELAPSGERYLGYKIACSAALTRHLLEALSARTTLLLQDLAYRLLLVGTGSTSLAAA